ncbi:MAG: gliding motility protein GldN [Muribaculaceae bacterium]|nr:gliding motility protein GldN [Muribaculaceae bacterium]
MKLISKFLLSAVLIAGTVVSADAQNDSQSSSVVRKRDRNERPGADKSTGVTPRMQSFYEEEPTHDADLQWMRVIYRQLDLEDVKNAPLYFPEEPAEGQENLFRIIMRLLANNQVTAYEYLDGREVFTDDYKIKVKDMLDRFHILYSDAKGSTEKNPKFVIEESDVPSNEVLSYYILERWEFDTRENKARPVVEAICPVLHRAGDFGGEAIRYPMFWIKLDNLRPYLAQQSIFTDDDNNLAKYTYDDFFQLAMYKGDIYKTRNLRNKSLMQIYPDPDDLKRAQDSIQNRLETFNDKLWVPSREEVIAAREKREAEQRGEDVTIASRDENGDGSAVSEEKQDKPATKRTTRGSKKPKQVKQSKPKQSSSSNNAVRSVRRRK